MIERAAAAFLSALCTLAPGTVAAQRADSAGARPVPRGPADSTAPADTPAVAGADTLPRAVQPGPETYFMVDTIIVVEDIKGLVWGDWYVNPDVSNQVAQVIKKKGQLSGRTWLQSAAPIRDLALGKPRNGTQSVSFVDKGEALNFWEPGEVEYSYVFTGPFGARAQGAAEINQFGPAHRVEIPLPVRKPPDRASLEARNRVGRLDITYRPTSPRATIPRGRFSLYLYYVNLELGYRIAGVGY